MTIHRTRLSNHLVLEIFDEHEEDVSAVWAGMGADATERDAVEEWLYRQLAVQPEEYMIASIEQAIANQGTAWSRQVWSYDAAVYENGGERFRLATNWFWFAKLPGGGYDLSAVSPARVQNGINVYGHETFPLLANIEVWDTLEQAEEAQRNLLLAMAPWQEQSSRDIGLYRLIPYSDYWTPVRIYRHKHVLPNPDELAQAKATMATRMAQNNANCNVLGEYLDTLTPRVYVSYSGNQTEWQWYAAYSILEAQRIGGGKPVRPMVSYVAQATQQPLTRDEFVSMLKFVAAFRGIDGIYVYSGGTPPADYEWTEVVLDLIHGTGDFGEA